MCSITTQLKDLFTGNFGWDNNCAKEDRETAQKPPADQAAKNLSDKVTNGAVEVTGQGSLGLLDGLTFGTFSYLSGAQVTCPPAYNAGLYGSMVPFPVTGGGKRLAVEGAEVAGRGLWTLTAQGAAATLRTACDTSAAAPRGPRLPAAMRWTVAAPGPHAPPAHRRRRGAGAAVR
ncbi:hypothetical protein [Streptomyces sp. NPDC087437]|uniref:hypothetical protein n=1 Tax=Streptomyces sp. NPDC087437 TaxID=3365789 RepID=UPI00382FDD17